MTHRQPTPRIEVMMAQLKAAGWTEVRSTLWQSPNGVLYRGPYHAWKVMKAGGNP